MIGGAPAAFIAGAPPLLRMRQDLIGRRIGFDTERGVGEKPDPGGRRLLQFAVRAAMPEGRRHSPQDVFVDPRSAISDAYAADATHTSYL